MGTGLVMRRGADRCLGFGVCQVKEAQKHSKDPRELEFVDALLVRGDAMATGGNSPCRGSQAVEHQTAPEVNGGSSRVISHLSCVCAAGERRL